MHTFCDCVVRTFLINSHSNYCLEISTYHGEIAICGGIFLVYHIVIVLSFETPVRWSL